MSLPNAYSLKTSSIPKYFTAILEVDMPQDFNANFMTSIGFRYAIDRSFIDILKELHFLCDNGMPTKRYTDFYDLTQGKTALFNGIYEAYGKLFEKFPEAQKLSETQVVDALRQLYEGKKTDMMISGISATFVALCRVVDDFDAMASEVRRARQAEPPQPGPALPPVAVPETVATPSQPTTTGEPTPSDLADEEESEPLVLGPEYEIRPETQLAAPDRVQETQTVSAVAAASVPEAPFPESEQPAAMAEATPRQVEPEPLTLVLDTEEPASAAASTAPVRAATAASEPEPLVLETDAPDDAPPLHRDRLAAPAPLAAPPVPRREPDAPTATDVSARADAMPEVPVQAARTGHALADVFEPTPLTLLLESDVPGEIAPSDHDRTATPPAHDATLVLDLETPPLSRTDADAKTAMDQETSSPPASAPTDQLLEVDAPATGAPWTVPADEASGHGTESAFPLDEATTAIAESHDAAPQREVPRPARPTITISPSLAFEIDLSPSETAGVGASPSPPAGADDGAEKAQRRPLQIVLPESTDPAVYDAIFASLKRHLLDSDA
ncbi:DUF5343 domain-containing protein [Solidesulfovibrio sp.]|uniref:DUF5343 domain-containing protein n=1 Tax=Solidesulfovibrio sp. TaxID=2910990 RepID=UPI00262915BF|nr:DUF5343 domain-containing protein [Solidesulfovibrio sp.]